LPRAKKGWRLPGGVSLATLGRRIRDIDAAKALPTGGKPGLDWTELCKAYKVRHRAQLTAASFGFHLAESLLGTLADLGEVELWYTCDFGPHFPILEDHVGVLEVHDDADWSPDCALGSYGDHNNITPRPPHLTRVAAPRPPRPLETLDADPGSWALSVLRLSGAVMPVCVHDGQTIREVRQKVEQALGLLPGQGALLMNKAALGDSVLVNELRGAAVELVVTQPMIKLKVDSWAHILEGSHLISTKGAILTGGEVVRVVAVTDESADIAIWNPKCNDRATEDLSDTVKGVPLKNLIAARRPQARPVQAVARHDGTAPTSVSFVTPGVIEERNTMWSEQPSRRDTGFCAPGSLIVVTATAGGGGLNWIAQERTRTPSPETFLGNWKRGRGKQEDLLNQRKVGPFDARFQELLVGTRRVALPADPSEASNVLSQVRALAFAAGLSPGCVLIPEAFRPGLSLGQRVCRPVTGREGVINEYNRGARPYRMEAHEWSAPLHELVPVT